MVDSTVAPRTTSPKYPLEVRAAVQIFFDDVVGKPLGRAIDKRVVTITDGVVRIDDRVIPLPDSIEVTEEIRPRGSNGHVFVAQDTTLKRRVAVKVWLPLTGDKRNKQAQGAAEARKIAGLSHARIATVFEAKSPGDECFYQVMEYLDGPTLRDWLRGPERDFLDRFRIWKEIDEAVVFSHANDVYHGDLHPGNVVVQGGHAKLIDFGTSIYAGGKARSAKRESGGILELAKKIFPEHDLDLVALGDWRSLQPRHALDGARSWARMLLNIHQLQNRMAALHDLKDPEALDYDFRRAALEFSLCAVVAPLFDLGKLCGWYSEIFPSTLGVSVFLDSTISHFQHILESPGWGGSWSVHYDPSEPITKKLDAIASLFDGVHERYMKGESGPWDP